MTTQQELIETQIREWRKQVNYNTLEYPVETIVQEYLEGKLNFPEDYKKADWDNDDQAKFIESLLLGLPSPYVTALEHSDDDICLEIIDGVQRIRSLVRFFGNELRLEKLGTLESLNGFKFSDLPLSRQRKFKRTSLRVVQFAKGTNRDLFDEELQ